MNHALAHLKKIGTGREDHLLFDHLVGVSNLAEFFGNEFENGDWLKTAGLLHDLGKFNPEWQTYLLKCNGEYESGETDDQNITTKSKGKIDHSAAGAIYCFEVGCAKNEFKQKIKQGSDRILGYLIAGHHTGLPDWNVYSDSKGKTLPERLNEEESIHHLKKALNGKPPSEILSVPFPQTSPCNKQILPGDIHLWIRMMYSCLVDADYLDTENFMNPQISELRSSYKTLQELKDLFDSFMEQKIESADFSPVNDKRQQILEECRNQASLSPGLFSLTVPTGGGKTLSSMAFALEHAIRYNKKRIIVAIPYTSIIEQTASEYKKIFGAENVIEHHCNLDPEIETAQSKLATENWDAPIIVTTNVRLFESLFASKSSECRKLHNIVNSVLILDEAQTFPPEFLKPILKVLNSLAECFKTSVVLCTATQPILAGKIGSEKAEFKVLDEENIREIASDPASLFQSFRRVQIKIFGDLRNPPSWEEVARELKQYNQVLCIVNTKKDCLNLHEQMPAGTIHLSGYMCARHRSQIIQEIKSKLKENEPVRVICTQIIEAGVDIDFPVVFRALSGLDSIAQAAGRCNREGKKEKGTVYVFKSLTPSPSGFLRKAEETGFELYSYDLEKYMTLTPQAFEAYFKKFYSKINHFDKADMEGLLVKDAPYLKIQFRTASNKFKMIDDSNQYAVIVKYCSNFEFGESDNNIEELIEKLRRTGPDKYLMRQLQGYTVTVYEKGINQMIENGTVENINGIYVQSSDNLYDSIRGLQIPEKISTDDFFC